MKSLYSIAIVRRSLQREWREKWDGQKEMSRSALAADRQGLLGETRLIEAANLHAALREAQSENPDHVVIVDASGRVG